MYQRRQLRGWVGQGFCDIRGSRFLLSCRLLPQAARGMRGGSCTSYIPCHTTTSSWGRRHRGTVSSLSLLFFLNYFCHWINWTCNCVSGVQPSNRDVLTCCNMTASIARFTTLPNSSTGLWFLFITRCIRSPWLIHCSLQACTLKHHQSYHSLCPPHPPSHPQ